MFKSYSMELGGRTLTLEFGKYAEQASGATFVRYGETCVLVTAIQDRVAAGIFDILFHKTDTVAVDSQQGLLTQHACTVDHLAVDARADLGAGCHRHQVTVTGLH